ncbi:protein PET100 homolog, mitochondrial [Ooceraea biroi]|uniref:Protein PET100-like protein, mitochondrial n=1 Tax=Ooceraea biroi TaxID=2015173 RepID=A0A026WZ63_OOCBI|nr:protein PET100 homolog, mitochondrial [Ooceraea biroi]XP_019889944.1 protein PET100 homolog, mitochondrial [Ooceraea biroi]EZA61036.1 hypothetical protein X777_08248 [Ooceraea biroi]
MGWVFEVAKMFMYISFPVGIFHYYHHPMIFEKLMIEEKKKYFPPTSRKRNAEVEDFINKYNYDIKRKQLEAMEMQERGKY